MRVIITPDYPSLSVEAARIVANTIRKKPDAVLALPTGCIAMKGSISPGSLLSI
jgi:hypothetical protein